MESCTVIRIITEEDVRSTLTMAIAVERVEAVLLAMGEGRAINYDRTRIGVSTGTLHWLAAAWEDDGVMGIKVYTTVTGRPQSNVLLYSTSTGRLLAMFSSWHMSGMRTAAATAVATRYLAVKEASTLALIGTGHMARLQAQAIQIVRPLSMVKVWGRSPTRTGEFVKYLRGELDIEIRACASLSEAVEGAEIVTTATSATVPFYGVDLLEPGVHINAIGSNDPSKREIEEHAVAACDLVVVDSISQGRGGEAGDILPAVDGGLLAWSDVLELGDVIARKIGRSNDQMTTLFKSQGIAVEDIAVGMCVYRMLMSD